MQVSSDNCRRITINSARRLSEAFMFCLCPFLPTRLWSPRRSSGAPSKVQAYQWWSPRHRTENEKMNSCSSLTPPLFLQEATKCEIWPRFSTLVAFEAHRLRNGATYIGDLKHVSGTYGMIALNIGKEISPVPPLILQECQKLQKVAFEAL